MRRSKLRRSLSLSSSLDIQQKVAASWLESESKHDDEEQPAFRWDKFQSPQSVVDEPTEAYRWDQTVNVPALPKMTIPKPAMDRGVSAPIPKPSCLRNRGISAPVVEANPAALSSSQHSPIPKPSCLKQRGLSATIVALKQAERASALARPKALTQKQRGVSAPIKTDVFDWESFHDRNSMPCGRGKPRRPTPPRGSCLKKNSNGSLPIFEDDDSNSNSSTHSFVDDSELSCFRRSTASNNTHNSLDGDTEHSKVCFRGSIRIFEIPRYCDKKEGNKEEYFYTKKEIKTFKAEKKQEKKEAKKEAKKEKRRKTRSLSPVRHRRKSEDLDDSFH